MILYVNGQDIGTFVLGLIGDDVKLKSFSLGPEKYLLTIEAFLKENDLRLDHLKGIIVVTGPGSATALRSSLAIVNTIHFSKRTPLFAFEKAQDEPDANVVTTDLLATLQPLKKDLFAQPVYAYAPRITPSKKDALGRRKT